MRTLSVHELTFAPELPLQDAVEQTARAGIRAIGLSGPKVDEYGFDRAKRLIRDAGLEVSGHTGLGFWTLPGDHAPMVETGKRVIDEAAELEADFVLVKTGPRGNLTLAEARARFLDGVRQLAGRALESNVDLALEPSHPMFAFFSIVYTLRDALDLAAEVEGMGVILDTFHSWWDPRLPDDIRKDIDRIYNVQLSDYGRTDEPVRLSGGGGRFPLGEGLIPLREIMHDLDDAGYARNYDLEIIGDFSPERRRTLLADSKRYFDALWEGR